MENKLNAVQKIFVVGIIALTVVLVSMINSCSTPGYVTASHTHDIARAAQENERALKLAAQNDAARVAEYQAKMTAINDRKTCAVEVMAKIKDTFVPNENASDYNSRVNTTVNNVCGKTE